MSIPYESDATAAAAIVPTDAWVEYPFSERLDNTTVEYKIKCSCKRENYSAPAFTAVMDTAANAGLTELPFTANANAYFLGDENFSSDEGELITFTRAFGTKPVNVTYMESSYTYTFPEYRGWYNNFDENIKYYQAPNVYRKSMTKTVTAKVSYSYHISTSNGTDVNPDSVFSITLLGNWGAAYIAPSTWYYDLGNAGWLGAKANYVSDTYYNYISFPGTDPSRVTYMNYIANGTELIVESNVRHYKGNVFEKKTIRVKAR
ncbi:MAG: hypothetical protein GY727_06555 [Gammaproteobacteria bacterium]|nr:hypothetical protein [Gammaproteobacteria bacterium]